MKRAAVVPSIVVAVVLLGVAVIVEAQQPKEGPTDRVANYRVSFHHVGPPAGISARLA